MATSFVNSAIEAGDRFGVVHPRCRRSGVGRYLPDAMRKAVADVDIEGIS